MKNFFFVLCCLGMVSFASCDHEAGLEYSIEIMKPTVDNKKMNDDNHIHVIFESATERTIHHINVRIYNTDDSTEIFNMPSAGHISESGGIYEYHSDFNITEENGFSADSNWTLEAKVWGHEAGAEEVIKSVEFHVDPE